MLIFCLHVVLSQLVMHFIAQNVHPVTLYCKYGIECEIFGLDY